MEDDKGNVTTTQDKIDMEQMQALIPVMLDNSGRQVVDGRQLHDGLKISGEFTDWIKRQLDLVDAVEGEDYIKSLIGKIGGTTSYLYQLTIDTAKEICMIAGTNGNSSPETKVISKRVRKYFIWCEKQFSFGSYKESKNRKQLPQTYLEALKQLVAQVEENEKLREDKNKLIHQGKLYTTTEIAKELNLRSPQQLNKYLEHKKVQYEINGTWVLYSKYSESNYVSTKQQIDSDTGKISYSRKWTGEGRDFILSLWKCEQMKTKRLFEVEDNKFESNNLKIGSFGNQPTNQIVYAKDYLAQQMKEFEKRYKKGQEVNKKSIVGVHVKTGKVVRFDSVQEAANALGTSQQNITNCLRGTSKSAKGYKWYYAKDYDGE